MATGPDMIEGYIDMVSEEPALVIAPIVALFVTYILFYEGLIYKVGSTGTFWTTVRRVLPHLDAEAREHGFYTQYTVSESEYVCTLMLNRDDAVEFFVDELGLFIKAPVAAHKENWDGLQEVASLGHYGYTREEIESWSRTQRFIMFAFIIRRQLHVTLFKLPDELGGHIVVTAHDEYSPYNVFKAFKHFIGTDYDITSGVEQVRALIEAEGEGWWYT